MVECFMLASTPFPLVDIKQIGILFYFSLLFFSNLFPFFSIPPESQMIKSRISSQLNANFILFFIKFNCNLVTCSWHVFYPIYYVPSFNPVELPLCTFFKEKDKYMNIYINEKEQHSTALIFQWTKFTSKQILQFSYSANKRRSK